MSLAGILMLMAGFFVALLLGSRQQQRALAVRIDDLHQLAAVARTAVSDAPTELPEPVARYLRSSLPPGESINFVRLHQVGNLRTDARSDRWMPFTAEQHVAPRAVGFVWNARVTVAPWLHVRVRDAYVDGEGSGPVALLSAVPISSAAGTPEMNSGALHRFLAEAVWYPNALRPSEKLRWTPIDATRSLATLTDRGVTVSLEFRFDDTGHVTAVYTPARWGSFSGRYEQRPWEGHFREYVQWNGVLVPTEGDVGWYVDGVWHAVWSGRLTEFELDLTGEWPNS